MFRKIFSFILFSGESKVSHSLMISLRKSGRGLDSSGWLESNNKWVFHPFGTLWGFCILIVEIPWLFPSLFLYFTQTSNILEQLLSSRPSARDVQGQLSFAHPLHPAHTDQGPSTQKCEKSLSWPQPKLKPIGRWNGGMSRFRSAQHTLPEGLLMART